MTLSRGERRATILGLAAVVAGLGLGLYFAFASGGTSPPNPPLRSGEGGANRDGVPSPSGSVERKLPPVEFFQGRQPQLVLMLTGEMQGFLMPCGCTRPQLGGLERRYELMQQLRAKGWTLSAADLGELAPKTNDPQSRIKYETSVQILKELGYAAVGLGLNEATLPLKDAFDLALSFQPPLILAANLDDKESKFPGMFQAWTIQEVARPESSKGVVAARAPATPVEDSGRATRNEYRVGYVGVVSQTVAEQITKRDSSLSFGPVAPAVTAALKELELKKPDVQVLLFHGPMAEAKELLEQFPQFHVVLTQGIEEPSALAQRIGSTLVVSPGHKGRYVGLVGVFARPASSENRSAPREPARNYAAWEDFELAYQLYALDPSLELPDERTNPARERLRDYVARVHRELAPGETFLTRHPKTAHALQVEYPEAAYAGSAACKECHPKAYKTWSESKHAKAYEGLSEYGRPRVKRESDGLLIGRQFDPDCVKCHTTGFDYRSGFVDEKRTPHLKGNGCENCHGPAGLHVVQPKLSRYSLPLRLSVATVDQKCRTCHDADNDPKFDLKTYWRKIQHGRE